jgi:hypothetical protein
MTLTCGSHTSATIVRRVNLSSVEVGLTCQGSKFVNCQQKLDRMAHE